MKNVAVFGSTGSIGVQTLSVCSAHREEFNVTALVFGSNTSLGISQITEYKPSVVGVYDDNSARIVRDACPGISVLSGEEVWSIAGMEGVDTVVNGVSGFSGVFPLITALEAGRDVALANKESVVCAGGLVDEAIRRGGGRILPVDSEQSAIFQCLSAGRREDVKSLILTASGGPFREYPREMLSKVTPEMAVKHPTWNMGRKISIDSATMFNKGLEVMEAAYLFKASAGQIRVLIHPQSVVHSMVEFRDGSVVAQLGVPDMRTAIQYALTYPERTPSPASTLTVDRLNGLTFFDPDAERFPALPMAYRALKEGDTLPTAYNSGNEAAVGRFVDGEISFTDIARCVGYVMDRIDRFAVKDIDSLLEADRQARRLAKEFSPKETVC